MLHIWDPLPCLVACTAACKNRAWRVAYVAENWGPSVAFCSVSSNSLFLCHSTSPFLALLWNSECSATDQWPRTCCCCFATACHVRRWQSNPYSSSCMLFSAYMTRTLQKCRNWTDGMSPCVTSSICCDLFSLHPLQHRFLVYWIFFRCTCHIRLKAYRVYFKTRWIVPRLEVYAESYPCFSLNCTSCELCNHANIGVVGWD